jgi:hypothetical protein
MPKLERSLTACGVELCKNSLDLLLGITPYLEEVLQLLPCAVAKYFENLVSALFLLPCSAGIERLFLAAAALFPDHVFEIIRFLHRCDLTLPLTGEYNMRA